MIGVLTWMGIGVFGALGALTRFRVAAAVAARAVSDFPVGTFLVNVTGSFVLGVLTGLSLPSDLMFVLATGFLGSYTTFSTWMVETLRLGEDGEWLVLYLYLAGSMLAGLAAAGAGWLIGGLVA
jgi:fluoride exporter